MFSVDENLANTFRFLIFVTFYVFKPKYGYVGKIPISQVPTASSPVSVIASTLDYLIESHL